MIISNDFRPVLSTVQPGYLYKLVPPEAPIKGEDWKTVLEDVEKVIMPGITHWSSPQFHAFFPTGNSYPALIGDLLCNGIGCIGFSWVCIFALLKNNIFTIYIFTILVKFLRLMRLCIFKFYSI